VKSVWITRHGGPEVLEVRETPDVEPKPGEVRLRIKASGLNFSDLSARQGMYPDAPPPPCVVGYEAVGVIDKHGDGVGADVLPIGTRAVAMSHFGGHADMVCVPAQHALALPDQLTFEQGAAIPVNYLTAYHMLFRVGQLRPGMRVLVHMAAGGVGIALLQLCRTVPGVVVFGTASASKHDVIRSEGCTHPIDYHTIDYGAEVRRLTDDRGVDMVLDPLGGDDWRKGYRLLAPAGMLIAFGLANSSGGEKRSLLRAAWQLLRAPWFTPFGLMNANRSVAGVNMGHMFGEAAMLRPEILAVLELCRAGQLVPRVDSTFPFEHAADAHRRMHERKNIGKVVLIP